MGHQNDAISVNATVKRLESEGDNGVFMYKPQGEVSKDYPKLTKDDFVLGYMSSAQEHLLNTFGGNIICMDGTHGTNAYGFELTKLITLDDQDQGFPVLFFFHSSKSQDIYKLMFQKLKEKTGPIKSKVFMSDDEPAFYNAWADVMGDTEKKLLCTWHVLRNWKKHLKGVKKELKDEVMAYYRAVLQELDLLTFEELMKAFLNFLSTKEDLTSFREYFENYYVHRSAEWAHCFRIHAGINTNMHIERIHKEIKYIYLEAKTVRRVDISFSAVRKFLKAKQYDRLISLHRWKLTTKDKILRKRHNNSVKFGTNLVMPMTGYWLIRSSSEQGGGRFYNLTRYEEKCPCALRCPQCKVCIHAYRCSCHDSSIKSNMCKHIHLLCRFLKESMPETEVEDVDQCGDHYIHTSPQLEARAEEVNVHVSSLVKNSCGNVLDLDGVKSFFLSTCDLVADTEGLRILNDAIKTGNALLRTHNSSHNRLVAPKMVTLVSPLSKIDKQLRFVPKKKKASETAVRENNDEVVARLIMRNKFSCSPIAPDAGGTDVAIETDGVNSLLQEDTLSATKEDEDNMKIGSRGPSVSDTLGPTMPNVGSSACSSSAVSPGVLSILSPLSSASPTRNRFTTGRSLIPIAVRPSVLSIGHGNCY